MRNAKEGTYNDVTTFCPVFMYGDCPHCDQCNVCHIDDPQKDCDEWQFFWENWDEWFNTYGEVEEEPDYDWGYNEDEGFDPYAGEYTWDC